VPEGNVGGGTGMICHEFKGGTGTASRVLLEKDGGYRVGALIQANHGARDQLMIAGVPVGKELHKDAPWSKGVEPDSGRGSIIIVLATDAPLLPHQLKRLARRAALGIARTGGTASNGSGDIFIAFSAANPSAARPAGPVARVDTLPNDRITPLFDAAIQATEEAIVNTLIAAKTMTGVDGHQAVALPHDRLCEVLAKYNRLEKK
jgi:L-aminopeptidase/D-esterase-like protein